MKKNTILILHLSIVLFIIACFGNSENKCHNQDSSLITSNLVVYTPHHRELINPIVTEFETQTGIKVDVRMDSTKELLKTIEIDANHTQCDVYWGGSSSTIAPISKCLANFISENETFMMDGFKNNDSTKTMFTNVPSVLIVNTNLLGNSTLEGYQDLLRSTFKGRIALADPQESSSSFEHLVNILFAMGEGNPENGWPYLRQFVKQLDGNLLNRSVDVYQGVANGQYTVGLTFEEGAARMVQLGAPVKIVYMKEGVIFRADGIYILKSAKNIHNAKIFVNFCTSREIQTLMASKLNRRPIRKDVFPAKGLMPLDKINVLHDGHNHFPVKKDDLISKFKNELNCR